MKQFSLTKVIFLSLLLGQAPLAIADFEIDLSGYEEGDIPTVFGEGLVIKTERNGKKVNYISGQSSDDVGKMNVALTNLSNSLEIIVDLQFGYYRQAILLLSDNEKQQVGVNFKFYTVKLGFNNEVKFGQIAAWKNFEVNSFKLKISGKLAKLYINDEFIQSSSIEPNIIYTTLQINGLSKNDKVFGIKGKGSSSSTTTTPTNNSTTTASGDCMATYSSNGKLHIPCVTAPNKSGGTSVYDITMQKQSNGFVFNVDMSSIKPR